MKPACALVFLLFFLPCSQAADLNKCKDDAGRITYTSERCEKEGLKPAGDIKDRVTILPAESPKPPAAKGDKPGTSPAEKPAK